MKAKLGWLLGALALPFAMEGGAGWADGFAFPHVNFYVAHPERGLALAPGATERISFSGNPITTVRTNSQGLRGGEWAPAQAHEVLIFGDSQVFGLGLDEDQTLAAVLGRELGRPVYNAGVPTYGPAEYLDLLDELLTARPGADVVIVWNASNDFFEAGIPNRDRHALWDGWAVRKEHAPAKVTDFPGRAWLMSRSHAVYALRQALHVEEVDPGVPSEGRALDLLPMALAAAEADAQADQPRANQERSLQKALAAELAANRDDDALLNLGYYARSLLREELEADEDLYLMAAIVGNNPGDIVYDGFAESARRIQITAEQLNRGAALREKLPRMLRAWLAKHPDDPASGALRETLLRAEGRSLPITPGAVAVVAPLPPRSPLHEAMATAKARVEAAGGTLTILMLPLDVQVSAEEWAKYGEAQVDMTESLKLNAEVLRDAAAMGLRVVDPLPALRAAEPGAFLHGDLHLSPKGAAAVGAATAAVLKGPPPPAWPGEGLPPGRSRLPLAAEWSAVREIVVPGSTAAGCETRQVREWLQLRCRDAPVGFLDLSGPRETLTGRSAGEATLVAPLLPGSPLGATLHTANGVFRLAATEAGGSMRRVEGPVASREPFTPPFALALPDAFVGEGVRGCEPGRLDAAGWLDCVSGQRAVLPQCGLGEVNAGATGHCFALCSEALPCAAGRCTPWQGSAVCL